MVSKVPSLLDLITEVDNVPLNFLDNYFPYYTLHLSPDPRPHGYIHPNTLKSLPLPSTFTVSHKDRTVTLSPAPEGVSLTEHANAAFQETVDRAIDAKSFPSLSAGHSEHFRVVGARSFVRLERFASAIFGIATRGSHMTAYVNNSLGEMRIWVARRSRHLLKYPGMLDSTVAGGVKAEHSPRECILAESEEEASLPAWLVQSPALKATGAITLAHRNPKNDLFHSEILYTYDLEMPEDIVPKPADDEVEEFVLMGLEEVRKRMEAGDFKPNVCPVLIDFLVRHGVIQEHEKGYIDVCARLRRQLPVPVESDV